jgi:hypothetical protein
MAQLYFGSNSTQTSTANQEIIQINKPLNYEGTFVTNTLSFSNNEDCHVKINNSDEIFIPSGGFDFGSEHSIRTFEIVEADIEFNYLGSYLPAKINQNQSKDNPSNFIGITARPAQITLDNGETSLITVTGLREGVYSNIINPVNTYYSSDDEDICSVSNQGLVSYVGSGETNIIVTNSGFTDTIHVTCN